MGIPASVGARLNCYEKKWDFSHKLTLHALRSSLLMDKQRQFSQPFFAWQEFQTLDQPFFLFLSLEVLQSSCVFRCGWIQPGGSKQHALVELLPPSGWALCSVKAVWDYGSLILSGYQAKPSVLKIYYNVLKLCGAKILSLKTVIY